MDIKDYKILWNLDNNARMSLSELSKKVKMSKQNLNYRIKKLIDKGVISHFSAVINESYEGSSNYRVYYRYKNVDSKKEEKIINYLINNKNVIWFASLSGCWDLEVMFLAKDLMDFNNIIKRVNEDLRNYLSSYNPSLSTVYYYFKRDYLIGKNRPGDFSPYYETIRINKEELTKIDKGILFELSRNCRQSNYEIGNKLGVSYHTIKNRINLLEKKKIIKFYHTQINISKINYKCYKIILKLNNPRKKEEEEFYKFCSKYNFVTYIIETLGEWQLEIEAEVKDQEDIVRLLKDIRNKFPNLIMNYDIIQINSEHKLIFYPIKKLK